MRRQPAVLAAMLVMVPVGAQAADLVVWWDLGASPEEAAALKEVTATFEQNSGKQVELVLRDQAELKEKLVAAIEAGRPPDIPFGMLISDYIPEWAFEDGRRLARTLSRLLRPALPAADAEAP